MPSEQSNLIDALPFVDTAIDDNEELRNLAMKEVDDEMEVYPPAGDYLDHLPNITDRPFLTDLMSQGLLAIENNESRPPADELAKLDTETPPNDDNMNMSQEDYELWEKCANQLKIKLEYRQRQITNLELLRKYGELAWDNFLAHTERMEGDMMAEQNELNRQLQDLNRIRREEHETVSKRLNILRDNWDDLVRRNYLLSMEISRLRNHVAT